MQAPDSETSQGWLFVLDTRGNRAGHGGADRHDRTWCLGVTIDLQRGYVLWTLKGTARLLQFPMGNLAGIACINTP